MSVQWNSWQLLKLHENKPNHGRRFSSRLPQLVRLSDLLGISATDPKFTISWKSHYVHLKQEGWDCTEKGSVLQLKLNGTGSSLT